MLCQPFSCILYIFFRYYSVITVKTTIIHQIFPLLLRYFNQICLLFVVLFHFPPLTICSQKKYARKFRRLSARGISRHTHINKESSLRQIFRTDCHPPAVMVLCISAFFQIPHDLFIHIPDYKIVISRNLLPVLLKFVFGNRKNLSCPEFISCQIKQIPCVII